MVVYQHTDSLNRLDLKITLLEPRVHWQEKNIHKKIIYPVSLQYIFSSQFTFKNISLSNFLTTSKTSMV